eukprot:TRINITY_DN10328_c0_g1_i1.p1 TRINITY_DN10328_c0_g1~~TRINITY_DN10328_c0_g1_i1.p1  ORF type:complete len:276 (-),score=68.95 TRINITY_DN10328_c0_g1_i1:20-847(-)
MKNQERDLDTLLRENEEKIKELKESIKEIMDEKEHDEIFLLRYCLSNPRLEDAEKAIRFAVEYRKNNQSWLQDAVKGEKFAPHYDTVSKYVIAGIHKSQIDGGPIVIIRSGKSNMKKLMDSISEEEMSLHLVFQRELCYRKCDELTRKNKKLTKMVMINDMHGFSMFSGDKRFLKSLGDTSKIADNLYPQLVDKNVIINPPTIFKVLFSVVSLFMSKKSLSKITICKGNITKKNMGKCPYASKIVKEEDLPKFVGGTCDCKDGCLPDNLIRKEEK